MAQRTTKIDFSPLRLSRRRQRWAWLKGNLRANTPDSFLKAMVIVLALVAIISGVVVGLTLALGAVFKEFNISQTLLAPLVAGVLYLLFRTAGGGDQPHDALGEFIKTNRWRLLAGQSEWVPQFSALEELRRQIKMTLLRPFCKGVLGGHDFTFYQVDVAQGLVGTPLQQILPFRVLALRATRQLPSLVIDDRRTKGRFLRSMAALKFSEPQRWLEDKLYQYHDIFFDETNQAESEKFLTPKVLTLVRDHVKGDVILEDNYIYVLQPADFVLDEAQAKELFTNAEELAKALRL